MLLLKLNVTHNGSDVNGVNIVLSTVQDSFEFGFLTLSLGIRDSLICTSCWPLLGVIPPLCSFSLTTESILSITLYRLH